MYATACLHRSSPGDCSAVAQSYYSDHSCHTCNRSSVKGPCMRRQEKEYFVSLNQGVAGWYALESGHDNSLTGKLRALLDKVRTRDLSVQEVMMSTNATEGCDVMADGCGSRITVGGCGWVSRRDALIVGRVRPCVPVLPT
jgi:hypothetical protein